MIHTSNTVPSIKFKHPPFVDGSYKQVIDLIYYIQDKYNIKDKETINFLVNEVHRLEDREKYPIRYIKRWAVTKASNTEGKVLFKIPFLMNMDDKAQVSEEEMEGLKKRVLEYFMDRGFQEDTIPYPLSPETILYEKKLIINELYYQVELENNINNLTTEIVSKRTANYL